MIFSNLCVSAANLGWSGGAMVLGKLPVPGRLPILITVGQGPTALAVGAGGGSFGHFYSHLSFLFSFSLCLSQRAVKPKTTNQPNQSQRRMNIGILLLGQ